MSLALLKQEKARSRNKKHTALHGGKSLLSCEWRSEIGGRYPELHIPVGCFIVSNGCAFFLRKAQHIYLSQPDAACMFLLFLTTTFASRGNLKTQNSHRQEPCGAESDLHCLGDRGRWAVGCCVCEQGRGLATGDGSIREGENSVASSCGVEHLEQLCWNPSMGTLGCPASRQPAGCWGCTARGPCSSFMNTQHFLMRQEH